MLTHAENETLCRVGRDTPMGKVMRRYWHPVAASESVADTRFGAPAGHVARRELVLFRDSAGKVGVLEENCMHRGASLALGRVEDGGIRCLYHGWKFGTDGTIQETPNNPDPRLRQRLKQPCSSGPRGGRHYLDRARVEGPAGTALPSLLVHGRTAGHRLVLPHQREG